MSNLEVGKQTSFQQVQNEKPFVAEKDIKQKLTTKQISSSKHFPEDSAQIEDFDEEGDETGGQNLVEKIKLQENIAQVKQLSSSDVLIIFIRHVSFNHFGLLQFLF